MDVTTALTEYTRYIPTRVLKGNSYIYAQSYFEAGEYGLMAIDPTTLAVLDTFKYNSDRISDFSVYSDSRIAIRSDKMLAVLSFELSPDPDYDMEVRLHFRVLCRIGIRSSINIGVACNNDFAFASCGSKIISLDIATGKIAQELNIPSFYNVRSISCTNDYLFARKTSINLQSYKLSAYEINTDYLTNPHKNLYQLDEIDSSMFDMDLGRLSVDDSLNIIEPCLESNRLVTFSGSAFAVVGDLIPFYPALEFVKHGGYYFMSPDMDLRILTRSGLTFTEEYNSTNVTQRSSYRCPGFSPTEFFSTRDILGDGSGRNISKNTITP